MNKKLCCSKGIREDCECYQEGKAQGADIMKKQWQDEEKAQANKGELKFLREFVNRNQDQIDLRVLNPNISKEDKAYNEGTENICKEQNKLLKERIKHLNHSQRGGIVESDKQRMKVRHTLSPSDTNNKQEKQRG